jgi:hypothetical protein
LRKLPFLPEHCLRHVPPGLDLDKRVLEVAIGVNARAASISDTETSESPIRPIVPSACSGNEGAQLVCEGDVRIDAVEMK